MRKRTPSPLNQCCACGEDFASLAAFDAHILIKPADAAFDCMHLLELKRRGLEFGPARTLDVRDPRKPGPADGGRKLFPSHRLRGWHRSGGVPAPVQLVLAGFLLGILLRRP